MSKGFLTEGAAPGKERVWRGDRSRSTGSRRKERSPRASGVQLGEAEARARILAGAARVFSDGGVREASVRHLLDAAGVARRTFYRLYTNKEDVVVALYRIGTDRLLDACRLGMSEETDPIRQIHRCIEAHLRSAREIGRLVFVLGGEAQRHESSLHPRRMETHAALVELIMSSAEASKVNIDPLLIRALVLALEGVTRIVLEEGDHGRNVSEASIERARRVMIRMATAALAGDGPGVAPLPASS
jgi:AcrR family transcriptional regulator